MMELSHRCGGDVMEAGIFAILGAFFAGGGLATMTGRHQAAAKILQRWGPAERTTV